MPMVILLKFLLRTNEEIHLYSFFMRNLFPHRRNRMVHESDTSDGIPEIEKLGLPDKQRAIIESLTVSPLSLNFSGVNVQDKLTTCTLVREAQMITHGREHYPLSPMTLVITWDSSDRDHVTYQLQHLGEGQSGHDICCEAEQEKTVSTDQLTKALTEALHSIVFHLHPELEERMLDSALQSTDQRLGSVEKITIINGLVLAELNELLAGSTST